MTQPVIDIGFINNHYIEIDEMEFGYRTSKKFGITRVPTKEQGDKALRKYLRDTLGEGREYSDYLKDLRAIKARIGVLHKGERLPSKQIIPTHVVKGVDKEIQNTTWEILNISKKSGLIKIGRGNYPSQAEAISARVKRLDASLKDLLTFNVGGNCESDYTLPSWKNVQKGIYNAINDKLESNELLELHDLATANEALHLRRYRDSDSTIVEKGLEKGHICLNSAQCEALETKIQTRLIDTLNQSYQDGTLEETLETVMPKYGSYHRRYELDSYVVLFGQLLDNPDVDKPVLKALKNHLISALNISEVALVEIQEVCETMSYKQVKAMKEEFEDSKEPPNSSVLKTLDSALEELKPSKSHSTRTSLKSEYTNGSAEKSAGFAPYLRAGSSQSSEYSQGR